MTLKDRIIELRRGYYLIIFVAGSILWAAAHWAWGFDPDWTYYIVVISIDASVLASLLLDLSFKQNEILEALLKDLHEDVDEIQEDVKEIAEELDEWPTSLSSPS